MPSLRRVQTSLHREAEPGIRAAMATLGLLCHANGAVGGDEDAPMRRRGLKQLHRWTAERRPAPSRAGGGSQRTSPCLTSR